MYLCNMPHSRSGYTPFELMFGTKNPNVIATLKSYWTTTSDSPVKITDYLENLQHNINTTLEGLKSDMADKACLERSKLDKSNLRSFSVGDLVLKKVPGLASALDTSWEGPYEVTKKMSDLNYAIVPQGKKSKSKIYHINQLKKFVHSFPYHRVLTVVEPESGDAPIICAVPDHFKGPELSSSQKVELDQCLSLYKDIFSDCPGNTQLA